MPHRPDISNKVIHFTSGTDFSAAFDRLRTIIKERRLTGNNESIRGGHRCVCFTEAPLTSLARGLVNPKAYSRYSPFGIMLDKSHLFERGGRPVIYQSDSEYPSLPAALQWRHVRYEPAEVPPIDFTWEREWRIQTEELELHPSYAVIVVQDTDRVAQLRSEHEHNEDWRIHEYGMVLGYPIAEQYREDFPWRIVTLN